RSSRPVVQQRHRHQRLYRRVNKRNRFPKLAALHHRARAPFLRTRNGNTSARTRPCLSRPTRRKRFWSSHVPTFRRLFGRRTRNALQLAVPEERETKLPFISCATISG